MEKQKTTVRVAGREYTLVSADSPEYIGRVAAYVDRKISEAALAVHLPADKAAGLVTREIELYRKLKHSLINEVVTGKREVV